MNLKKLKKIKKRLQELAASPQGRKSDELVHVAKKLGRTLANRGKEPTYVKIGVPQFSNPLSIPQHPGDLKTGTARSIIDQLMDDADIWEQHLDQFGPDAEVASSEGNE